MLMKDDKSNQRMTIEKSASANQGQPKNNYEI